MKTLWYKAESHLFKIRVMGDIHGCVIDQDMHYH